MVKRQPKTLEVSKNPGQISAPGGEFSNYLLRNVPVWGNPGWMTADIWRQFVHKQPVAVLCRDAISSYLLSLDWTIVAKDSEQQDELKDEIKHYTKLLERGNSYYSELEFSNHVEMIVRDLFDLPFGAASELGREYNAPDRRVVWIRPLDGGTLTPTLDVNYPVVQHFPNYQPVAFPREFISRTFLSPRTEIQREGWGMAPPEKIYLAMEMLNRGDVYYSQLLLNTPEAGILDLGDMDKESATEWVKSFRDLMYGINVFKVPVLYEHTTEAKWIPFGKLPSEIMYDSTLAKYVTIVTAGYGLSPSDIGFASSSNGGETLAGTIRQERRSAKSGKALAKAKLQAYFQRILPDTLEFKWVDFDDERNVAMSRARMASANAFQVFVGMQAFSPDEVRRQAIADGLISITVPETIDRSKIEWPTNALRYIGNKSGEANKGSNEVGDAKAPSSGGQGQAIPQQIIQKNRAKIEVSISKAVYMSNQIMGALLQSVREKNELETWGKSFEDSIVGKSRADMITESVIDDAFSSLVNSLDRAEWIDTVSKDLGNVIRSYIVERHQNSANDLAWRHAEEEFIAGNRESIELTDSEIMALQREPEIGFLDVKRSLIEALVPKLLLISKSAILDYKYPIDTSDKSDNNNLKLARAIAETAYTVMPKVLEEVQNKLLIGEN